MLKQIVKPFAISNNITYLCGRKTNTIVTTYTDDTYTTVKDITNIGHSEQIYYHCILDGEVRLMAIT